MCHICSYAVVSTFDIYYLCTFKLGIGTTNLIFGKMLISRKLVNYKTMKVGE